MKIGEGSMSGNIFLRKPAIYDRAPQEKFDNRVTSEGVKNAEALSLQYGQTRKITIFGSAAVALTKENFAEIEAKFGKAQDVKGGYFTFNDEGSDFLANWYLQAKVGYGYEFADGNKDGVITNHESLSLADLIDFDGNGNVFHRMPQKSDNIFNFDRNAPPDEVYSRTNDFIDQLVWEDKDKDGVITEAEFDARNRSGITLDYARALSPHGKVQALEALAGIAREDAEQAKEELNAAATAKAKLKKQLRIKLEEIQQKIESQKGKGIKETDSPLRELLAQQNALTAQLQQAETRNKIDVEA